MIMQRPIGCISIHLRWIWTPWVQWDNLFSVSGSCRDDLAQCTILVQFCHVGWPVSSREMIFLDLLGRCMRRGWSSHLFLPYYPPSREPIELSLTTLALQEAVWAISRFPRQIKNNKNGYWRIIFGILRKGNGMGLVFMMSVMSSTPSPAVSALGWTHIHLSGIFYYFMELWEVHDFLREALFCT